ncbi:MAG TPA: hypothetical protein VGB77_13770 [Abditibacteriaceae bacterium]|jgi:hypothetical protein
MKLIHRVTIAVLPLVGLYGLKVLHYHSVTRTLTSKETTSITVCEVHEMKLQKDVVPISYGLFAPPDLNYVKAMSTLFPHSSQIFKGGCVVEKQRYAEVLYCTQCREAEEVWSKTNANQK